MGKYLFEAGYSFHDNPQLDTTDTIRLCNTDNFFHFGAIIDRTSNDRQRLTVCVPLPKLTYPIQIYRIVFSEPNKDFLFIAHAICLQLIRNWVESDEDRMILNFLDKIGSLPTYYSVKKAKKYLGVSNTSVRVQRKPFSNSRNSENTKVKTQSQTTTEIKVLRLKRYNPAETQLLWQAASRVKPTYFDVQALLTTNSSNQHQV